MKLRTHDCTHLLVEPITILLLLLITILLFFFFFDNSGIWAATVPTIPRRGSSAPAERMLNPLWPGLEVVMAGTSAEVSLPPDHEARL